MASGDLFFNQELAAAAAMAGEPYGRYFASSVHGFPHFQHPGSAPAGVPDMGFLVSGIGMPPAAFVMQEGALQAAGYGAPPAVPVEIPAAGGEQMPALTHAGPVAPCRGVWTDEEDEYVKQLILICFFGAARDLAARMLWFCARLIHELMCFLVRRILKKMVVELGDRKWAAIAHHLPGRIGKQCRERWTNHLRPDLRVCSLPRSMHRSLLPYLGLIRRNLHRSV
jgi:hypothetical protein